MAAELEGGCRVVGLREGAPTEQGALRIWTHFGRASGAEAISLRVLELAGGPSPVLRNAQPDEVLYVLAGEGTLGLDDAWFPVFPGTGVYVAPGVALTLQNPGPMPLTVISSRCPDPGDSQPSDSTAGTPRPAAAGPSPLARLWDRAAEVSGDRWYRVLVDAALGSAQVTQFVGSIPPGRAPDHYHQYEEVLCILDGAGRMWAGATSAPIGPGSCVFLPRGQVHCVENTGSGELLLLGFFYPAGSPAVRYDPD